MGFVVLLVVGLLLAMLKAKAIMIMWGWFLIPIGLPAVPSFGLMLGCVYIWGLLYGPSWEDIKEHGASQVIQMVAVSLAHVVFTLGIGWMIKMAMSTG